MRINKISLTNFRNIEHESFSFESNFTVIIGINGKGKSTLLHAIRIACGAYLLGIPETVKRHIWPNEIRRKDFGTHLALQTPTIVEAEGSIDNKNLIIPWRRIIPEGKAKNSATFVDIGQIRSIAKFKYDQVTKEGKNVDNPVIAFFGTSRLSGGGRDTLSNYTGREIFKAGYNNWLEMKQSTYQYPKWLKAYDYRVKDKREIKGTKEAFFEAIRTAVPFITQLTFDGDDLVLKIKIEDFESPFLPLNLHSDGIITHTSMVAELAYRCIMLNAHHGKNAIKESRGIVMIDELDLHLHPTWQKQVVLDLKNAFPNIQFVATTHSPFIVQSLKSEELINLDKLSDVEPVDLTLEEVAEDIMGVEDSYAIDNLKKEKISEDYLLALEKLKDGDKDQNAVLDDLEIKISDPAMRAFLKMQRLENNVKGKKDASNT
ncbi:AAA family ATPase [Sphingobacterium sp. UBA1498]|uniref:AAA family ATPase n=1 Tax=Sphingobacterium sp. UBA1498 TaxID=1947481 RepID=UPI0025FA18D7|nr:AAA family ATPase [Sphingobacterium sp. UBA1498]